MMPQSVLELATGNLTVVIREHVNVFLTPWHFFDNLRILFFIFNNNILHSVFFNRLASTKMGGDRLQIPNQAFQRLAASHPYGQH